MDIDQVNLHRLPFFDQASPEGRGNSFREAPEGQNQGGERLLFVLDPVFAPNPLCADPRGIVAGGLHEGGPNQPGVWLLYAQERSGKDGGLCDIS